MVVVKRFVDNYFWLLFGLVFIMAKNSAANFNLYLSKEEVRRILGLNAELYYIREGVVNDYAMRFSVKVPPEIHSIFFRWEALSKRPVLYNMAVWLNDTQQESDSRKPLLNPSLNISMSGTIPKATETFQLNLPCTGLMSGEVEVILNLNATSPRPNQSPTVLYFNRRKICLKGIAAEKLLPRKSSQIPEEVPEGVEELHEAGLPIFAYVLYGLVSLGLVLATITAVACWKAFQRNRKYPFRQMLFSSSQSERKSTSSLQKSSNSQMNNIYTSPGLYSGPSAVYTGPSDTYNGPSGTYTAPSGTYTGPTGTYKGPSGTYTGPTGRYTGPTGAYTGPSGTYTGPSGTYTGPSGTYTLPSALSGNSYASVYKFPFQSADLTTSAYQCKCEDSSCSGIYESSCYSNSKSESYLSSRDSKEDEKCHTKHCEATLGFGVDVPGVGALPDLMERFRQLQMDRERVRLTEVIQEGKMGRVYKGWLQREHPELDQQVVIKTLSEGASPKDVDALCREGTVLSGLRHQNLMSLVGLSFVMNSPPFLIFPDPLGRNFKQYLKKSPVPLSVTELADICLQAAKAVSFMHSNHVLHKDIAARNCTINEQLHLRLADSALSRDFFPEDYEGLSLGTAMDSTTCRGTTTGGDLLPVRWMPIESLKDPNSWSSASDVWSLGVLLWEASTHGSRPYSSLDSASLHPFLSEGNRLIQAHTCPDELHHIMVACWSHRPHQRLTSHQVAEFLSSFRQSLNSFV